MKKIAGIGLIAIINIIAINGCSTSSNNDVAPVPDMTAIAGIHTFSVSGAQISATKAAGTLNITASDTVNKRAISFIINHFTAHTGTYTIDNNIVRALYDSSATSTETGAHGSIIFSSVSPTIIGTFSFTCQDSTKIQSGIIIVPAP